MSTSAQLAQQNLQFAIALSQGKINQAQYDQAMAYQAQLNKPNEAANPPAQTQTTTPSTPITTPLPTNPQNFNPVIQDNTGTWIQQGSTVTPITQPNPENPSQPTIIGYNVTPPPSPTKPTQPQSIGEKIATFNPAQAGADLGSWIAQQVTGKDVSPQYKQDLVKNISTNMGSGIPGVKGTPTEFIGGMVSSVEAPIYSVATFAGAKNLPRPKTSSGALLTSGWESITSLNLKQSQEFKDMNMGSPAYAAGSIAGDIGQALIGGEIIKAVSPAISRGVHFIANKNIPVLSKGAQITEATSRKISSATNRIVDNIPVPKIGKTSVALETKAAKPAEATWQGLYISKGDKAYPLLGKASKITKGTIIKEGYVPASNLDTAFTKNIMTKAGYPKTELTNVDNVTGIMRNTQNVKSKFIEDIFPAETKTLSPKGVNVVKETVLNNKSQVKELYGSFANKPQISKKFEYKFEGNSALRDPGDIDIQLVTKNPDEASKFAETLTGKLKGVGENVRISKQSPTLIESYKGDKWSHAVDIHYANEPAPNALTPSTKGDIRWGFKIDKPTTTIEKIPVMSANEQGLRKGSAILEFQPGKQSLGTKDWRGKDIPDFLQTQKSLIQSMKNPIKSSRTEVMLNNVAEHYGVSPSSIEAVDSAPKKFTFRPETPPTSPTLYSPAAQSYKVFTSASPSLASQGTTEYKPTSYSPTIAKSPSSSSIISRSPSSGTSKSPASSGFFKLPTTYPITPASKQSYSPASTKLTSPSYSPAVAPSKSPGSPSPHIEPYTQIYDPSPYLSAPKQSRTDWPTLGGKTPEQGGDIFGRQKFTGLFSVKRQYDILTAEEFMGI